MLAGAPTLFSPFRLGSLDLPNRIVMAPMTRSFSPNGTPTAEVAEYYARRARAGVGLIISEGAYVGRPFSGDDPSAPHFFGDDALAGWRRVLAAVHAEGGRMAPQLWHVGATHGRRSQWPAGALIESPSGLMAPGRPLGVAMTEEDIADTISAFAEAASTAKSIGFDAVELHAAHGYLIDQFFWDGANLREDRYGGASVGERTRFAADLVRAVRKAVGPEYPVIVRVSQWKQQDYTARIARTPDELAEWLCPLVDAGADALHCSQRRYWEAEFEGSSLNLAGWAKKVTGSTTITVGSVGLSGEFLGAITAGERSAPASLANLVERLESGEFDLVAVGRALLADPQWALKIREGRVGELSSFEPAVLSRLY